MANISTIGRDCSQDQRSYYYEWDQEWGEREFICSKLSKSYPEVEFSIGGEISIDIYPKGKDKSQVLNDIDGETTNDFSGNSVALSADGSVVAIGAAWIRHSNVIDAIGSEYGYIAKTNDDFYDKIKGNKFSNRN